MVYALLNSRDTKISVSLMTWLGLTLMLELLLQPQTGLMLPAGRNMVSHSLAWTRHTNYNSPQIIVLQVIIHMNSSSSNMLNLNNNVIHSVIHFSLTALFINLMIQQEHDRGIQRCVWEVWGGEKWRGEETGAGETKKKNIDYTTKHRFTMWKTHEQRPIYAFKILSSMNQCFLVN